MTIRAVLEVEQGAEPIRGWLAHEDGCRTPFYGWLDLARLIGALATGEARPTSDGPAPEPPSAGPAA